ncbi:MAG: hypothetical protein IJ085_00355, partial [Turicibacter sp.]|nr:hypothetical protein [Turicibacter sp.]
AIHKWGWDAFKPTILFDNIDSKEELDRLERLCIGLYDSYNNGYNSTLGGGGSLGCSFTGMYGKKHTEEAKQKNREAHLGLYNGEKHPMYGKKHTEEAKMKIREARKKQIGKNHPMFGKQHSEETKIKIGLKSREIQSRPDIKKKNRQQALGNKRAKRSPVKCVELNKEFDCIADARRYMREVYQIKCDNISDVCLGKRNHCGTLLINEKQTKLHWIYIDIVND